MATTSNITDNVYLLVISAAGIQLFIQTVKCIYSGHQNSNN